jgi:hypothetical protein
MFNVCCCVDRETKLNEVYWMLALLMLLVWVLVLLSEQLGNDKVIPYLWLDRPPLSS